MTRYERDEIKKWNIAISKAEAKASEKAREIENKYLGLNGSRSCNPERFIFEIATTAGLAQEEKLTDIRDYVHYLNCCAKGDALSDILHIY